VENGLTRSIIDTETQQDPMKIQRKLSFLISGKAVGSVSTIPIEVRYLGDSQNSAAVGRVSITVTPYHQISL
jgi:hypothetical protein